MKYWAMLRRPGWDSNSVTVLRLAWSFNLLWLAGGMVLFGVAGRGDFAYSASLLGLQVGAERVLMGVAGVSLAWFASRRIELPKPVLRAAWITAGAVSCGAALFYAGAVAPALREAALESFGAMGWMLLAPSYVERPDHESIAVSGVAGQLLFPVAALAAVGMLLLGHGYQTGHFL